MSFIRVKLKNEVDKSYPIVLGQSLDVVKLLPKAENYVIVTDSMVAKLYGNSLLQAMEQKKLKTILLKFPAGEKNKNRATKERMEDQMIKAGCNRNTVVIALGGGVVGDMAGFVAASYMRGVRYVQIPTTLLAMVDSSVGGKTAVDTVVGKNLIGAFWQPQKVIIDLNYLNTLPRKQFINGLVEAIKMFLTHDKTTVNYVEKNIDVILNSFQDLDKVVLQKIVSQAVKIKAGVVERDEKENNERMVLNLGHTVGHAIEQLSGYKLLHGFAVGLGILVEAKMAVKLNILDEAGFQRVEKLFSKLNINVKQIKKYPTIDILNNMKMDKKGQNKFILLKNIGQVYVKSNKYIHEVNSNVIKTICQEIV